MEDSTYKGVYLYSPDAVNPGCGQVKLEIYSSKGGDCYGQGLLTRRPVQHVWADFDAFRRVATQAASAARPLAVIGQGTFDRSC